MSPPLHRVAGEDVLIPHCTPGTLTAIGETPPHTSTRREYQKGKSFAVRGHRRHTTTVLPTLGLRRELQRGIDLFINASTARTSSRRPSGMPWHLRLRYQSIHRKRSRNSPGSGRIPRRRAATGSPGAAGGERGQHLPQLFQQDIPVCPKASGPRNLAKTGDDKPAVLVSRIACPANPRSVDRDPNGLPDADRSRHSASLGSKRCGAQRCTASSARRTSSPRA
jgi:hypothetical protein